MSRLSLGWWIIETHLFDFRGVRIRLIQKTGENEKATDESQALRKRLDARKRFDAADLSMLTRKEQRRLKEKLARAEHVRFAILTSFVRFVRGISLREMIRFTE